MSYWNHRILQETLPTGELWFSVREIFYNQDGSIYAYDVEPVNISGKTVAELREYVQWILNCLDKPVLVASEVVFANHTLEDAEKDTSFC